MTAQPFKTEAPETSGARATALRDGGLDGRRLLGHSGSLPHPKPRATILIIEDNPADAAWSGRFLRERGYEIVGAATGELGLLSARSQKPDAILLDLSLPGLSGLEILGELKGDPELRGIPVIMLSGSADEEGMARCIEMGAEDYLSKSSNPVLLGARTDASLERKRLHDLERGYLARLQNEQEKSERLLLNILPRAIAERLKDGETSIAELFPDATVLFADVVGFTTLSANSSPTDLVRLLNQLFSAFDRLAEQHNLEKIKTIGDAYMAAGGLPTPRPDHAEAVAELALYMLREIVRFNARQATSLNVRIGINSGPVVAGIIGEKKFAYDLWGDTVNTASRMEAQGEPGAIQVTAATYERLKAKYRFENRGLVNIKGKGEAPAYLLTGRFAPKSAPQFILSGWVAPTGVPKPTKL